MLEEAAGWQHLWLVALIAALVALAVNAANRRKDQGASGAGASSASSRGIIGGFEDDGRSRLDPPPAQQAVADASTAPWELSIDNVLADLQPLERNDGTADAEQSSEATDASTAPPLAPGDKDFQPLDRNNGTFDAEQSSELPAPMAEGIDDTEPAASEGPGVVVVVCETVPEYHAAKECIQRFPSDSVVEVPANLRWKVVRRRGLHSSSPEGRPTLETTGLQDKLRTGDEREVLDEITNDETTFFKVADEQWVPRSYMDQRDQRTRAVCELFDSADGKQMLRVVHPKGASFRDSSLQRRRDPSSRSASPTRTRGEKFDEGVEFVSLSVASDLFGNPMLQVEDGWLPERMRRHDEGSTVDVCCSRVGDVREALPAWADVVQAAAAGGRVVIVNMYAGDAATVESLEAATRATEWAGARFVTPGPAQDAAIAELASK